MEAPSASMRSMSRWIPPWCNGLERYGQNGGYAGQKTKPFRVRPVESRQLGLSPRQGGVGDASASFGTAACFISVDPAHVFSDRRW